jgi:8-oxo-dGTP pyrophosphatase MutT (NUDIX family)
MAAAQEQPQLAAPNSAIDLSHLALLNNVPLEGCILTPDVLSHDSASVVVVTRDPETGRSLVLLGLANTAYISKGKQKHLVPNLITIGGKPEPGETVVQTAFREAGEETPALKKFWAEIFSKATIARTRIVLNNALLSWFNHDRAKPGAKKPFYAPLLVFHADWQPEFANLVRFSGAWFETLSDEEKSKLEVERVEWVPLDALFAPLKIEDVRQLASFSTCWSRDEQAGREKPVGFDEIVKNSGFVDVVGLNGNVFEMPTFVARTLMLGLHQMMVNQQVLALAV